ncbi:hypothetical protein PGR6_47090 [Pseudomonas sp. GR 6-02]|nr:hypothetical protein PGR6_47090 [Pseudomonas sp. GR 6-02]
MGRRGVAERCAGRHVVIPDSHVPQWSELLWSNTQGCGLRIGRCSR